MDDDVRQRTPASFDSQIHQQTTTCFKIDFFSNFFWFFFTEFQNEGGRKPRRPPPPPPPERHIRRIPNKRLPLNLLTLFLSRFLKLHLRTKYVSYVRGLPPLSHFLRYKMLAHRDWFSSIEIFNIVRKSKMIQTVFDLGWPSKCALTTW
jgi:hypothetical protein